MRIVVDHSLSLTPPAGTSRSVSHLLLTALKGPGQTIESWDIEGAGMEQAARFTDGFGNVAHLLSHLRPEGEIVIRVRGEVVTREVNGMLGRPAGEPVIALYRRQTDLTRVHADFCQGHRGSGQSRLNVLHALMAEVGEKLGYTEGTAEPTQTQSQTQGGQTQEQGFETAQEASPPAADFAHLFIGAARGLDIPARFVTGYLAEGTEGDAGLHAWAEAYDDGLGWIGFDPSLQICPTEHYVRLAVGLDAEMSRVLRTVPDGEIQQIAKVVGL